MTSTKKTLLKTGSIIAIVLSCLMLLICVPSFQGITDIFSEELIIEEYKADDSYKFVKLEGDNYYFEYKEDGEVIKITREDIQFAVNIVAKAVKIVFVVGAVVSIASIIIAILLLINANKEKSSTGKIIALMILSFLMLNFTSAIIMLVALCIKDKRPTLNNINDYVIEK